MPEQREQPYRRVNLAGLESAQQASTGSAASRPAVRWWIIPLSALLCVLQAVATVMATHLSGIILTPTLISVVAFGALFLMVLVLLPLWRALSSASRRGMPRPLNRAEVTCLFTAMLVTSGISTFGLSDQLVPMVATPWNEEWNTAQRGWDEQVLPHLNSALYLSAPADASPEAQDEALRPIRQFRQGLRPTDAQGRRMALPPETAPLLGDGGKVQYWWALFRQVPWSAWLGPLTAWGVFIGACYGMFYCLTYLVLGYWLRREKLMFPLARLPEQMLPDERHKYGLPAALRSSGFWMTFLLVFALWSWNGAVAAEWIPGLGRINLGMGHFAVADILSGGIFEGLTGGRRGLQFLIIFTALGLAFLLPTHISFSLWFYFLVGKAMILALVWMGHGQTGSDFPTGFFSGFNTVTAQGSGGLLLFAAISLWRVLVDFVQLARGQSLVRKVQLSLPVTGLVLCLAVIAAWLHWSNLPLIWAILVTVVLMLVTLGLMRVVAEGGVYWFQLQSSPMHLFEVFALGQAFKPAAALVPLIPIFSVLFFDTKTFLAPNLANAGAMQEGAGASRFKFHLNIILCLIVSVVVALGFTIFLGYLLGAQQMNSWFYVNGPQHILDNARQAADLEPVLQWQDAASFLFGGAWVLFSMAIRSVLLWFPHPIGYVMLVNPLMSQLWFSFFLGWIAKRCVVRYGGKQTFDRVQPIFLGLIMGELMAVLGWAILGIAGNFEPGVALNRYGP